MQNKSYDKIALVLQGGGALGSYQSGVYKGLCEAGYKPDWVSGTSIGAINGAIIASNPAIEGHKKLQHFWERVSQKDIFQNFITTGDAHKWYSFSSGIRTLMFGNPAMFTPHPPCTAYLENDPEKISFYDPSPLRKLLREVIDFNYLNDANMRLTINAVNLKTGKGTDFDNTKMPLLMDHIMACSALPPAMPAVRIGNDLYWDAGVLSNTPLAAILEETPRNNILCFMIDLFNPGGDEPDSLSKVLMRQKEISYASASDTHIAYIRIAHNLRRALNQVVSFLPEEERNNITTESFRQLGYNTTIHIVHLLYRPKNYEWESKDYDFSSISINEHFNEGYLDVRWALEHSSWMNEIPPDAGVILHEIKRGEKPVTIY